MTDPSSDAQLVTRHLDGDPSALAGIYDRYADSLHDTAAAMLNDRDEAADTMQDVFVIASQRLDQLRDPERLKPWLFAILRNEVYRRSKQRRRTVATDFSDEAAVGLDMADERGVDAATDEVAGEELAELVRGAARGLDERDQLVLELSVRQGLEGQDLADALGVSANQSYTLVHRMRERVERSLGAYCVARAGRKDCDELNEILARWDGEFTVLIRKRVARHVDRCDTCADSRKKVAPLALFGAAPVLAAPPSLRDRVLDAVQAAAGVAGGTDVPYGFGAAGGFPGAVSGGRRFAPWVAPTAAASVLVVAAVAGFAWLNSSSGDSDRIISSETTVEATVATTTVPTTSPATTAAPATTESPDTTSTSSTIAPTTTSQLEVTVVVGDATDAPATTDGGSAAAPPAATSPPAVTPTAPPPTAPPATAPPPTAPPPTAAPAGPPPSAPPTTAPPTTAPPTTAPPVPPGQLAGSSGTIALGGSAGSGAVTLSNVGGQALDWSLAGSPAPFAVAPAAGSLAPGAAVDVVASVDRSGLTEGDYSAAVSFTAPGSPAIPVSITASVDRDPSMTLTRRPQSSYCSSQWSTFSFSATVNDESAISGVTFAWTRPDGVRNSNAAALRSGQWTANAGTSPPVILGTWSWGVTATDARGNSTFQGGSFVLDKC